MQSDGTLRALGDTAGTTGKVCFPPLERVVHPSRNSSEIGRSRTCQDDIFFPFRKHSHDASRLEKEAGDCARPLQVLDVRFLSMPTRSCLQSACPSNIGNWNRCAAQEGTKFKLPESRRNHWTGSGRPVRPVRPVRREETHSPERHPFWHDGEVSEISTKHDAY
jgi:hypothetical protein